MRATTLFAAVLAASVAASLVAGWTASRAQPAANAVAATLRPVSAFAAIADPQVRAVALFQEAGKVIQHPRCLNCHPASERPTQTDRMVPHQPLVVRGADGHGATAMNCSNCHRAGNYDAAKMPGHPEWHLAPASMAWQGQSLGAICAQLKDPARNGGKDLEAMAKHMAEDSLVGWGWSPGAGRTPAPGTQAEFGALFRAWIESGAHCPPG